MIFEYLYNLVRYDLIGSFDGSSVLFGSSFDLLADYIAILVCIVSAVIIVFLSILILKTMFCLLFKIFDR